MVCWVFLPQPTSGSVPVSDGQPPNSGGDEMALPVVETFEFANRVPLGLIHGHCWSVWLHLDSVVPRSLRFKVPLLSLISFIVTYPFLLFLVIFLRKSLRVLRRRSSPSRRFFYAFCFLIALVNFFRTTVSLFIANIPELPPSDVWPDADDLVPLIVNLVLNWLIWCIEVAVIVFLLSSHILNWTRLFKRVAIVTAVLGAAYAIAEVVVTMLHIDEPHSRTWRFNFVLELSVFHIVAHGVLAACYLAILVIYLVPFCKCLRAPKKKRIHAYLVAVFLIHGTSAISRVLGSLGYDTAYCATSASIIASYSGFGPLIYFAFLADYIHKANEDDEALRDLLRTTVEGGSFGMPSSTVN